MPSETLHALVMPPPRTFADALTQELPPRTIDIDLALRQHGDYVAMLRRLGVKVRILQPDARFPDGCFVQDIAVQCDDGLIIARPGAGSRRDEPDAIMPALQAIGLPMQRIIEPGTLDGGDVMLTDDAIFVGLSERTNSHAIDQLQRLVSRRVVPVPLRAGLHLLSSCSYLGGGRLLVTSALSACPQLEEFDRLVLPPDEELAANVLRIGEGVIMPASNPAAARLIASTGLRTHEVQMSEFQKRDGGVTCLSLIHVLSA